MTDLAIRPAAAVDVPSITAIYGEAVRTGTGSFELAPPTELDMAGRFGALEASGHPWLVGESNGAVVGYAYAAPYRSRPAYRDTVEDSIYLAPDARGKGIGKRLLAVLIDEATLRGYRQMIGVIGDSANAASVRLHLAMGFRHVGTLTHVGWKHGRWLDTVIMQLPLGEAERTPPNL